MKTTNEQSIKDIFNKPNLGLSQLLAKVKRLQALNQKLQTLLEPSLVNHCCVANYRDNCLIIQANNAAIALQLRYTTSDLLSKFRCGGELPGLASIQIIVRPPTDYI